MPINVNINNQNKHWMLVVLEKIGLVLKNILLGIYRVPIVCIKAIGMFFKRIWKGLVIVISSAIALLIIAVVCVQGYDYHIWSEALSASETMFETQDDESKKISLAYKIQFEDYFAEVKGLWENEFWKDNIYYDDIQKRIETLQVSAFKFVEKLAYEGNAKAQHRLGQIYYWIKKDYEKSAYWYSESANQGYVTAYNSLACAYDNGKGVKVDKRKAIKYFKMGAEGGCDFAQCNYGDLFMYGVKVKVGSHKEKRIYTKHCTGYLKSDEVDITEWNYKSLGYKRYWDSTHQDYVYYRYEEVDDYKIILHKDIEKAKYWWRKAAAQGNEIAKERLQKIYE